ncbi:hypothetical protein TSMEX_001462 [Taenia solium]|eukprot:TsM_000524100 transcript=TsM_000524100 gene=TsM_000524100
MQGSLHYTNIEHRPFNLACDRLLFIDLEYLPPKTPALTFGDGFKHMCYPGIAIPLFIAGPMLVLRSKCEQVPNDGDASFFYDLEAEGIQLPTPENRECWVCCLVSWLLRECDNFSDCCERLQNESQAIIYEVMKEIWCRLSPKPLLLSESLLLISKCIDLKRPTRIRALGLLGHPIQPIRNLDWSTRKAYSVTWMNAITRAVCQTLECGGVLNDVACFVFSNLIRILRNFVVRVPTPPEDYNDIDQFYILDAIRRRPITVRLIIMQLANEVSLYLTHVDESWFGKKDGVSDVEDPRNMQTADELAQGVVENIFVMNMPQLFYRNVSAYQLYVHHRDCQRHPERCPCQYARYQGMQTS